jgi:hypothetical protein
LFFLFNRKKTMADEFGNVETKKMINATNLQRLMQMVSAVPAPKLATETTLNIGRVCFPMRVTGIVDGKFPRVEGTIEGITDEYSESTTIKAKSGEKLCVVDKELGLLIAYPLVLDQYKANMIGLTEKFNGDIRFINGKKEESIVFTNGQSVSLSCEPAMLEGVELFSLVTVGISISRYAQPPEKQIKAYGEEGVSIKLKQILLKTQTTEKIVLMNLLENPQSFKIPLPAPALIIKASDYTHVRVIEKESKAQSKETLLIPVLSSKEQALQFFGAERGCFAHFSQWKPNAFSYASKQTNQGAVKTEGQLIVSSWTSPEQLEKFLQTHRYQELAQVAQCDFMFWNTLPQAKVIGANTWAKFGPRFFDDMPMVVMAKVNLYKTSENMVTKKDNVDHYDLSVKRFMCDFESFIKRNALPISFADVKAIVKEKDARIVSTTTPNPINNIAQTPVPVFNKEIDFEKDSHFLVNEVESCANFLATPVAEHAFDYYALTQKPLSDAMLLRVQLVREYNALHPDAPVSCGPVLWKSWDSNPDAYAKYCGVKLPADHPLLVRPCTAIVDDAILIYAFNRNVCEEQESKAREYAANAKKEATAKQRLIEDATADEHEPTRPSEEKRKETPLSSEDDEQPQKFRRMHETDESEE